VSRQLERLGELDADLLVFEQLSERAAELGGVVEQARPRVRLPRQAFEHALPGRQAHMRDGGRAAEIGQVARDQRDRVALQQAAEHDRGAARVLNRRHAPLRPLIARTLSPGESIGWPFAVFGSGG
jgi:hypothetical protein